MNAPAFNVQAAIAQAREQGPDMTKASAAPEYQPPAEGVCIGTLVAYVEIGQHEKEYKGVKKLKNMAQLVFELAGPKHQPKVMEDGTKLPHRITITENLPDAGKSFNEKSNLFKLFKRMNYDGQARHIAEMLGKHFVLTIHHRVVGEGDKKRTFANIYDEDGSWTIRKPVRLVGDALAGEEQKEVPIAAPEVLSQYRLFLWDFATKEMWDSLFIDGQYEARPAENGRPAQPAKSKNVLQERIMSAVNWHTSPMASILKDGDPDLSDLELDAADAASAAAGDPLAGLV